ncbi:PREDICTED: uncharacterized protein LOC108554276 [Eufriesea mexicana]|uniref:uncharacterized protein LOC108554276 n=1 Tax=Eufriesea mexicana TaxID=516756 RepID=UPI00083BBECC|nr:PREDICTED: uncharacterized protein LOC108554276 [Eufriesea mexicana]XP_017764975.1 PREDICTED: uncharacterized protein LOC108554276 [Eufriesea mexicana]
MKVSRIWQLVPLLIISAPSVFSEDNVCARTENYTVTLKETYTKPVIVNTFTWCLKIPPRCEKTRTEMRQLYRVKTESKTRIVKECCDGYEMASPSDEEDIRCVPSCEKCLSGVCVSPNRCQCIPGYQGDSCDTVCPPGTWGTHCREKCNCSSEDVACDPINGHCVTCPTGLRGQMCSEPCPSDRWGPGCAFPCDCGVPANECDPETGRCIEDKKVPVENASHPEKAEENSVTVNFAVIHLDGESSRIWETTENMTIDGRETLGTTDNPGKTTSPETTTVSTSSLTDVRTKAHREDNPSTTRPVIVLVSVPDRRRNLDKDRGKFVMKNPFARHVDDNDIGPPKIDYVKNIHTEVPAPPIPLDIALIVIALIVSLGVTSVAVVMVLHMRAKLLEAARLSIYEEQKNQQNSTKISSIVTGTLPQTPIRLVPLFASTPDPRTMSTMDNDDLSNYANGAATIGLRISGNLHGLLQEDHYDRPPATRLHLQSDFDANMEHVYDEIPLQSSPLSSRKNA